MEKKEKCVYETLREVNVSLYVEKKKDLKYISWTFAWEAVKRRFSDATYTVYRNPETNMPYDESPLGLMCYTTVTIQGQSLEMWLPVMDSANNAMKREPYQIQTSKGTKTIAAATMFDVNKTIMRCLTKNLAMFGLGMALYAGEDLPAPSCSEIILEEINASTDVATLSFIYVKYPALHEDKVFMSALSNKKQELLNGNGNA